MIDSGKTKSLHMLSDRSSYTQLAYSKSKLLSDDCLVAEIVVEPSRFVESRDNPEDIAEVEEDVGDDISTARTVTQATKEATTIMRTGTRSHTSMTCSHQDAVILKCSS